MKKMITALLIGVLPFTEIAAFLFYAPQVYCIKTDTVEEKRESKIPPVLTLQDISLPINALYFIN